MIWALMTVLLVVSPILASDQPVRRPHVVFICAENLGTGRTGFEGHPLVKTPHLDALADKSVFFSRCYTPVPQSLPARASILTGQYPPRHHVINDGTEKEPAVLAPTAEAFTRRLAGAGYRCGIVGRWELSGPAASQPAFGLDDYVAINSNDWKWTDSPVYVNGQAQIAKGNLTQWHGDRAVEFIEGQSADQPFCLLLNLRTPGSPENPPPQKATTYAPADVQLPETMNAPIQSRSATVTVSKPVRSYKRHQKTLKEDRARYFEAVSTLDAAVGKVLEALEQKQLLQNTVVIFTSDHGFALGEHGLFGTGPVFNESVAAVPLLVCHPAVSASQRAGGTIDEVVSLVDIAPTIVELAGLAVPMSMQGESLKDALLTGDTSMLSKSRFFYFDKQEGKPYPVRGVVTKRFKYTDYKRDQILYDLQRHPNEVQNLAKDFHYQGIAKALKNRLLQWRKSFRDPTLTGR
jgi:arylsulfatase A-like enzyme